MLVFGTRPEAIKMAPVVKEFQKHLETFQTIVCVTGQHREMLDQVLRIFDITPQYDLNIMKQGQDLYDVTSRVLLGMRDILKEVNPDVVLVHGDTTTSMAAALAAFYQQIPVGHVEAGLRTHNIYSPWPEEMNRQITGRIATYNFAPTSLSRQNLLQEGVSEARINITGNTVIDALYWVLNRIGNDYVLGTELEKVVLKAGYDIRRLVGGRRLVLITGHRRENFGDGFISMCLAIKHLTETYLDVDFVYPMHLNPHVRKPIHEVFGEDSTKSISLKNFMAGFITGTTGKKGLMTVEQAAQIAQAKMMAIKAKNMEKEYGPNKVAGEKFLAANKKKPGVVTLPSGVQYKVIKEGNGPMPKDTSMVKVNYEGKTIDGKVFDSSFKRGQAVDLRANQVIKGWTDALVHMPAGSVWEVYIPQQLAYGEREQGQIKPFSVLIFKIELISVGGK